MGNRRVAIAIESAVGLLFFFSLVTAAYSQVGNSNWQIKQIPLTGQADASPDIAADSAGNLHAVWLSHPGQDASKPYTDVMYAYFDGKTWSKPISVLVGSGYTPRIIIDRQGWLHMTVGIGQTLVYSRVHSSQAGNARNWLRPKPLTWVDFFGNQAFLLDSAGILYLVYQNFNSSTIEYIRSTDGGRTWSAPMVLAQETGSDNKPGIPDLIEDRQGTLHLVWSMTQAPSYYGGEGVYYLRSMDHGLNWSLSRRLDVYADGRNDKAWLASISEVTPGKLIVVWDRSAETGLRMFTVSNDRGLRWESPRPVPGNIIFQTGLNPMLKDGAGNCFLFNAGARGATSSEGNVLVNRWSGSGWSPAESIAPAPGAHYIRGVVTHGNEINLVWELHSGNRAIYHAHTVTDAPYAAGEPVPTLSVIATSTVANAKPTLSLPPSPTRSDLANQARTQPAPAGNQEMGQTLVLALLPAMLLVLAVVLVRLRR